MAVPATSPFENSFCEQDKDRIFESCRDGPSLNNLYFYQNYIVEIADGTPA